MSIEIRKDHKQVLDEVVCGNCSFHLERMGKKHWWMSIRDKNGIEIHLEFCDIDVPVITYDTQVTQVR